MLKSCVSAWVQQENKLKLNLDKIEVMLGGNPSDLGTSWIGLYYPCFVNKNAVHTLKVSPEQLHLITLFFWTCICFGCSKPCNFFEKRLVM